jgi:hypothetical protein
VVLTPIQARVVDDFLRDLCAVTAAVAQDRPRSDYAT